MELNSRDNEVINLLARLKNVNGTYPQEMLASRRQRYLKQVAEIGAGAGLALAVKNTVQNGKGVGGAPMASTLLETLLVVAIIAEASTVAYFYRDQIADFFRSFSNSPRVEEVSNPLVIESPIPTFEFTLSPVASETGTLTPIGTPSLGVAVEATNQGGNEGDSSGGNGQALSTPAPADNDNNGNQYGLTPKPERTKKPVSDDSEDNKSEPTKKK